MLPRWGRFRPDAIATGRGSAPRLGQAIEQLDDPTQTLEVEQVLGSPGGRTLQRRSGVGAAQGDGGVAPVGEPDDEIGISPSAEANDLDALAAEGVVRMGDGDESRRRLG
jgi:hypothetical protein